MGLRQPCCKAASLPPPLVRAARRASCRPNLARLPLDPRVGSWLDCARAVDHPPCRNDWPSHDLKGDEPMAQPDTARLTNPVKETLKAGGVSLGMTVRLGRSPDIARIAKASGHEFIFIDTQHSIFDLETIAAIAHTALAIGVAPLVRVRGIADPDV